MTLSIFDLFSVGIGPSSSHTVGPMRAAASFADALALDELLPQVASVTVDLYGSLAATGVGHGTPGAVLLGLEGYQPETITPSEVEQRGAAITSSRSVLLAGARPVSMPENAIVMHPLTLLPRHSNGMRFSAYDASGALLLTETYYSVGGGFIEREAAPTDAAAVAPGATGSSAPPVPFPFRTAAELLEHCRTTGLSFSGVMLANEEVSRDRAEIVDRILAIRRVMDECVATSVARTGLLPGGLSVRRRAPEWRARLEREDPDRSPEFWQEWVNLVALAVNEENASGGRVVTAPTNGAAGIIPAVLHYARHYLKVVDGREVTGAAGGADGRAALTGLSDEDAVSVRFLLAAAAVGVLYKEQASISGAEVGCQGEVGSASSMAAAGLAEVMGGTPEQVENAAEIAMEHNLGLTCDPIGGLVQIPCIERNAIAASKAINAAKMALWGDGSHHVSLDRVILTMRETGRDMSDKYKETSLGGLAVNIVEC
ncbi:L-serine ammonia-lyase [Herbiconiux daphne]|uniref:L-serine dehydratase n=1 Tax=Herbiconiux daphne TaxID=2970914 RepID=A0ABT2H4E9_9MICO|nr:L-serine ammonia-lyase [Herbiconiux daphne]MCS5734815.1 L-serine ammonia-lyase [Herbiconiux daphne]